MDGIQVVFTLGLQIDSAAKSSEFAASFYVEAPEKMDPGMEDPVDSRREPLYGSL